MLLHNVGRQSFHIFHNKCPRNIIELFYSRLPKTLESLKNMKKPGIWKLKKQKLEFKNNTKKPINLNNFYMLSNKILIWHEKSIT